MKCPFCAVGNLRSQFSITNPSGTFEILLCDRCQTEWSPVDESRIDEKEVQKHFFDEDLYTIANLSQVHRYWRKQAKEIVNLGYHGGKILDIGCNTGEFLYCLEGDWERHGIEIAEVPARLAEEKGIKVHRQILEECHFPDQSFDVVTLYALIEHLKEPRQLVAEIARIIKPGGLVVIMTGDRKSYKARLLGHKWHMYIPPLHQFYFCREALSSVGREFGLIEKMYYFNHGGMTFFKAKILKLLEKASLWQLFELPAFRKIRFYDHYYGYFVKK